MSARRHRRDARATQRLHTGITFKIAGEEYELTVPLDALTQDQIENYLSAGLVIR